MPVSIRGIGNVSPGSTSGEITLSTASQAGDCVLLLISADSPLDDVTFTPPAGQTWSILDTQNWGSDQQCCRVYYCKAVSAGAGSYTIGVTGAWGDWWTACAYVVYGHDATTPIAATEWSVKSEANLDTLATTAITTARDGCLLIWGVAADADGVSSTTAPSGYSNLTAGTYNQVCALASKSQATAGASGSASGAATATFDYGPHRVYLIAVQPAAGGTSEPPFSIFRHQRNTLLRM